MGRIYRCLSLLPENSIQTLPYFFAALDEHDELWVAWHGCDSEELNSGYFPTPNDSFIFVRVGRSIVSRYL